MVRQSTKVFLSHHFLEMGLAQGILQAITANCTEINPKANRPLYSGFIVTAENHPTNQQRPRRRALYCQLLLYQCYSLFNILCMLFFLSVFYCAVCIV